MDVPLVLVIFWSCYFIIIGPCNAVRDCPLGQQKQFVCVGSRALTCGQPEPLTSKDCHKERVCRCPPCTPWSWKEQCYKKFECPKKSHDGMSNNRTGHTFIVPGGLRDDGHIFAMHISALKIPAHWYHAVASLRFTERSCITAAKLSQTENPHSFLSITYRVPVKIVDLLVEGVRFTATIGLGFQKDFKFVKNCELKVEKVLDMRRYKADQPFYPRYQKYFLFGDNHNAFMTHIPTKCKDFQQIVWLQSVPRSIKTKELMRGVVVDIPSLSGTPAYDQSNNIIDPLKKDKYRIATAGKCCDTEEREEITIRKKYHLDTFIINLFC